MVPRLLSLTVLAIAALLPSTLLASEGGESVRLAVGRLRCLGNVRMKAGGLRVTMP